MATTGWYQQGAGRRACNHCDGYGRVTMGWPDNLFWDENASPCSHCAARGWVADGRTAPGASRRRPAPRGAPSAWTQEEAGRRGSSGRTSGDALTRPVRDPVSDRTGWLCSREEREGREQ
jgi:hypothetical protein